MRACVYVCVPVCLCLSVCACLLVPSSERVCGAFNVLVVVYLFVYLMFVRKADVAECAYRCACARAYLCVTIMIIIAIKGAV